MDANNKAIEGCKQQIKLRQNKIASLKALIIDLQKQKAEALKSLQAKSGRRD